MSNSQTITIASSSDHPITIKRFGYGTMRLTGPDIYGEPADRPGALEILKQAIASGVQFLDTADYYGEDVTNRLIAEALYPYPDDLVICTKVGATRRPNKSWQLFDKPENLRQSIDKNIETLKIPQVQLVHFRVMPGTRTPFEQSMGAMFEMQAEGKIKHVGVSNVTRAELETAMKMGTIATVENMYSHAQRTTAMSAMGENRGGEEILDICEAHGIPLVPYFSLVNALPKKDDRIATIAQKYNATVPQINIAWLLHRSAHILPIPGTASMDHFKENIEAANINLTEEDMAFLA